MNPQRNKEIDFFIFTKILSYKHTVSGSEDNLDDRVNLSDDLNQLYSQICYKLNVNDLTTFRFGTYMYNSQYFSSLHTYT